MNASNNDYHNSALVRPPEELLHQKCSALRGELDSSTPRGAWRLLESSLSGVKSPKKVRKFGKNRKVVAFT